MDFTEISKKWQKRWEEKKIFTVHEESKKPKYYVLEMYPYPSASFLHMGHVRNYTMGDVYARFKRMNGFNVLYPMGYDSFGLPAETAAKKEGIHPRIYADGAIKKIMEYQKALGNSYDWNRTLASHDPDYYRWNQYFFLKLYEKGLAYRKKAPVNWCPKCESVLANEEAESGKCWRCNTDVTTKELDQWFFKITAYADRLLEDLDKIEWPEKIKTMQRNWVGKSEGVNIFFKLKNSHMLLPTFTTRCDTIFSVTFIAIAPESPLVEELVNGTKYEKSVKDFVKKILQEKIEDRINEEKEKEGIFIGTYAINPVNNEEIPIYVSNFALMYGTGIVMCDAHDKRDFRFARKYNIPLKFVISSDGKPIHPEEFNDAFTDDGILFNSGKFSGMNNREALPKMADWLEKEKFGKKVINYSIRDWMISRQRYWGTPIPMVYCEKCGVVPVPEKDLPVLLPESVDFKTVGNPLATNKDFLNVECPICHCPARRETDTMGGFVDSSWYFLRYCDNKNKTKAFDNGKVNYWMPVDQYVGGAEHACMHLIYARFFIKALKDLGFVDFDEPFKKLFNQGIVYKDGAKMSKSYGNIVSQDEIASKYGIDTARLFLMFVASPAKEMEWSDQGIEGSFRLLRKVVALVENNFENFSQLYKGPQKLTTKDKFIISKTNKTIKLVTEQIDGFEFNLALISIMELVNELNKYEEKNRDVFTFAMKNLLLLLSPFTPHICEELWELIGNENFISLQKWPHYDETKIDEEAEFAEAFISNTVSDINAVLELTKIQKPQKITLFVSEQWKYDFFRLFRDLLEETRNEGEIIKRTVANVEFKKHAQDIVKLIPKLIKDLSKVPAVILEQEKELLALKEAKDTLEKEFGAYIELIKAEDSKESKAKNAMPGKVAILVG
jgi:leucyl-tRNA synthetase